MTAGGPITHASRMIAFARHMPLHKLVRRVELDVRRRVRDRWPSHHAVAAAPIEMALTPPLPVFAPRRHLTPLFNAHEVRFTFLNRTVAMAGGRIDWLAPGPGAADQLWRMNLHYMEYLEGVDDVHFTSLVDSWITQAGGNPRGAWRDSWNSYTLSLRVVVWMQQMALRRSRLPSDLLARMTGSLAAQMHFLEANLETDLGGNHLIKNIKALIWVSAFFEGPDARRWNALGCRLLAHELDRQILADGMHDERSASYHAQVFADLLECRHALGLDPLGGALDAALHGAAQVTADLAHPDGGPLLFNDAGLSMAYAQAECLAVCQRLLGRNIQSRAVFALANAGYFGARAQNSYLVADCGRIAPDDLPAHGHGDVLSFEWSVGAQRVIVDQGVYEYVAGDRRSRARASASHNTLSFEGADQADFFGAFRCGCRPNVEVMSYQARADGFVLEGTHDGYASLPGSPRHVRRFDVGPGRVAIDDRIEGMPQSPARIGFLLHPNVEVDVGPQHATLRCGGIEIGRASWRERVCMLV